MAIAEATAAPQMSVFRSLDCAPESALAAACSCEVACPRSGEPLFAARGAGVPSQGIVFGKEVLSVFP
jgi:hypothetical protein